MLGSMTGDRSAGKAPKTDLPLNDIIASVNDAAITARNVTNVTLGTAVTLVATILASSDEAILRNQLAMPFGIGVSIRLSIAYALMPVVFVFLHGNLLLQFHVLMERLQLFDARLKEAYPYNKTERDRWRRKLHGFAFVQFHTDDEDLVTDLQKVLEYGRNSLLWLVNQTAISFIPMLLLIATLVSFLRYQSEIITLVHRIAVLVDLALIVWFKAVEARQGRRPAHHPVALLLIVLVVFLPWLLVDTFSVWWSVALFLGAVGGCVAAFSKIRPEWELWPTCVGLGALLCYTTGQDWGIFICFSIGVAAVLVVRTGWRYWVKHDINQRVPTKYVSAWKTGYKWVGTVMRFGAAPMIVFVFVIYHATVPSGHESKCQIRWDPEPVKADIEKDIRENDPTFAQTSSQAGFQARVSRTLFWDFIITPLLVRGAHPCRPVLTEIPEMDRAGIDGSFANLLDRTCPFFRFGCRYLRVSSLYLMGRDVEPKVDSFNLQPTDLLKVKQRALGLPAADRNLRFAQLDDTVLLGADLRRSDLRGADLNRARLSGAQLGEANLTRATLDEAILQNVSLDGAELNFASTKKTQLQGATATFVEATGLDLDTANLDGSNFAHANLPAAKLKDARANGVNLDSAVLYGADLSNASFRGANLGGENLIGAKFGVPRLEGVRWRSAASLDGAVLWHAQLTRATGEMSCLGAFVSHEGPRDPELDRRPTAGEIFQAVALRYPELRSAIVRAKRDIASWIFDHRVASWLEKRKFGWRLERKIAPWDVREQLDCAHGNLTKQLYVGDFSNAVVSAACTSDATAKQLVTWYTNVNIMTMLREAPTGSYDPNAGWLRLGAISTVELYLAHNRGICPPLTDLAEPLKSTLERASMSPVLLDYYDKWRYGRH